MEATADLPVTLVIKAPNQKVVDHTVDCMLNWTVKKLKQHLENVYPSQPKEIHQKLIYAGKLLADHLTLKDVLRQFEDGVNKHTVHLVCAPGARSEPPATKSQPTKQVSSASLANTNNNGGGNFPVSESEGLRRRVQSSQSSSQPEVQSSLPQVQNPVHNTYNAHQFNPHMAGMNHPGFHMPQGNVVYTPEQYMYMQQMYAQYLAHTQYMQYYQTGLYNTPPNTPVTPPPDTPPANVNAAPAQQDNQNVRMNAQGGPVMDDDDDDMIQRDWLDWVYTLCRFGVLMSIVYFYSNLSRFIMVLACFIGVYLYQIGMFQLRRRNNNNEQQQQQQQQEAENRPQENNIQEGEEPPAQEGETTTPAQQPQPAGPGVFTVMWTFVSTFFTSLFPQPPPPVNVN